MKTTIVSGWGLLGGLAATCICLLMFLIAAQLYFSEAFSNSHPGKEVNLRSIGPEQIKAIELHPLINQGQLTIQNVVEIADGETVAEVFRLLKRGKTREQYPQSFGEKWGTIQCLKLVLVLDSGADVAYQVGVTSRRDLVRFSTYTDADTSAYHDSLLADGLSGVCDRLFPLIEEQLEAHDTLWVLASRKHWTVTENAKGKVNNLTYAGPRGRTSSDWGRGGRWSKDIR